MSVKIRRILIPVIALLAALATFIGCGGGGSSSEPGVSLPARTLSWEAPTSYVDSTPMDPQTELDRFEVYVKTTGSFNEADPPTAALSAIDPTTKGITNSFNLANLSPHVTAGPVYYVSLRAVALTGMKSDFSPTVSFSF
jgi:hypothetical protein